MEYTVLARRFRPQSFGEVVGQENISQALRNAIAAERVAHAYLFTGARGVGKTSTARILAKSLNCPNSKNGDPCNQCEICRSISVGSDVDVLEIDGASNRGIDEIRDLRANVNIKPMTCRYKIYIIDEVHMLTTPAFNALLKTLEEPPPNVKFIFCTTEPEKVPDTILSRCQRFDFGTIAAGTIQKRLSEIAAAEGVAVEPAAIELVARRANGSMRDSQSLFDQLLAFGGQTIGVADVHRLLGTAPDDRLLDLIAAVIEHDPARALKSFHASLDAGAQLGELTDQLLAALRDLMVLAAGATEAGLLSVGDDQRPALLKHATAWGLSSILAALQVLSEAKARMKGVTYSRILAELALVRLASLEDLQRLSEAVALLKSGKPLVAGPGTTLPARPPGAIAVPPPSPRIGPPEGRPAVPPAQRGEKGQSSSYSDNSEAVTSADRRGDDRPDEGVAPVSAIPFESGRENEIWAQVITILTDMTRSHAKNVVSAAISGPNQLVLTFPKSYHLSKQYFDRSPEQMRRIEAAIQQVVGQVVKVVLTVSQAESSAQAPADQPSSRAEADRRHMEAENDPLVKRAMAAFGATVVRVESASGPLNE